MWWIVALSVLGCLLVLYLDGRRNEVAVWRDWELLLTPKGERAYEELAERVQDELAVADLTLEHACQARQLGSTREALELLDAGYGMIAGFAPDMRTLLANLAAFSRMVSAMAPLPPLQPKDYRVAGVWRWAQLDRALHHFLVSTAERFRLRVYVLGRAFQTALQFMVRSRERAGLPASGDAAWSGFKDAQSDFRALSLASLQSFRALLTSVGAAPRERVAYPVPDNWTM